MNEIHLNYLIQIGDNEKGYVGNNSLKWATSILPDNNLLDKYLDRKFNRYELFDYCQNRNNSNLNVLIAILSWGGMRRNHGRLLFNNLRFVLDLVENLRNGMYVAREKAYAAIQDNRTNGIFQGLGIGYFTKLICFLSPKLNGYIMDQWVAKSINLLSGRTIVKISTAGWVNDNNDYIVYKDFCTEIDELAQRLNCTGIEAEKRIFSNGGTHMGKWRTYLIANYHN